MKAILKKIVSNHQNLRSDEIEGEIYDMPRVGSSLVMVAPAFDPEMRAAGGVRFVRTTPVTSVAKGLASYSYYFNTQNSTYQLILIEERSFRHNVLLYATIVLGLLGLFLTSIR